MKKYILDLTVTENVRLHANYVLLKLTSPSPLPDMLPGQLRKYVWTDLQLLSCAARFPLIM